MQERSSKPFFWTLIYRINTIKGYKFKGGMMDKKPKTSKKRSFRKALLLVGLLFLCLFATPMLSKADFGDFSGDSDYGGGSYDSGWSSSSSYDSYGS